jgi:hypothetical protein
VSGAGVHASRARRASPDAATSCGATHRPGTARIWPSAYSSGSSTLPWRQAALLQQVLQRAAAEGFAEPFAAAAKPHLQPRRQACQRDIAVAVGEEAQRSATRQPQGAARAPAPFQRLEPRRRARRRGVQPIAVAAQLAAAPAQQRLRIRPRMDDARRPPRAGAGPKRGPGA